MASLSELLDAFPAAAKDIKLNVSGVLSSGSLEETERHAVAVACAYAVNDPTFAAAIAAEAGAKLSEGHVEDAKAAAALMGMTNIFYRFRHLVGKESYQDKPPRLRMNAMASPKTDKRTFELLSLAVSIIGGCEDCVRSHEKVVREAGLSEDQVNDAARIAATINAAARVRSWG
jgi:lipoyl-dependent peroxiredoxin subunit D